MPSEQFVRDVMSGRARGAAPALLRLVLLLAEPFYALGAWVKNKTFDWGIRRPKRLARPVISIGNITTGGTGKTPVVALLAGTLRDAGTPVVILSRGYKVGPAKESDEVALLAEVAPVFQGADRFDAGTRALQSAPSIASFLLDDGFQHRQLHRDLDIVLIDGTNPFGYDHVLPRGMLREPLAGLSRAGAFVITRFDQSTPQLLSNIQGTLARHNPGAPVFRCSHQLLDAKALAGRRVFAFCGLGNPNAFFDSLRRAGAIVVGTRVFSDHHPYCAADLQSLEHADADWLVTTEKDAVRLKQLPAVTRALHVARMEVRFEPGDAEKLLGLIWPLLRSG